MESMTKFWLWLRALPIWARAVVLALISCLMMIFSMFASSCGTPKTIATISNVNPNSTVTVTMSVSNATSTTPSVDTSMPLDK